MNIAVPSLACVLTAALSLVSCSSPQKRDAMIDAAPNATPAATQSAPVAADGTLIEGVANGALTLEFPYTAGTGYLWTATNFDRRILDLEWHPCVQQATDQRVGATRTEKVTLNLRQRGFSSITFELRRPWETGVPPAEVRRYTIVVR